MGSSQHEEVKEGSELEEEAFRIAESTNEDGTVEVEVTDIRKEGQTVVVEFQTPWGEIKEDKMQWPKSEDDSYKIVRICKEKVGTITGIKQVKGSKLQASPTSWEIVMEEKSWYDNFKYLDELAYLSKGLLLLLGYGLVCSAVLAVLGLFVLVLALPFGIEVLSLTQGASVFLGSAVLYVLAAGGVETLKEEYFSE